MDRRLQSSLRLSAALLSLNLAACDRFTGTCLSIGRPAVVFTLRDAASNNLVTSGATVTLVSGTFADTVQFPWGESAYGIGMEREGNMRFAVEARGYARWERTLTVRRAGACDYLQTVELDVRLQRLTP